jgi:phosphatidylglycerophosphate synthase
MTIPNFLSGLRLALTPFLLVAAWFDQVYLFLAILIFAFILDAVDGPIARRLHQVSKLGSMLDSWADFFVYIIFVIGAWWLWPEVIMRELVFILLVVASIVLPVLLGLIKFKKITSYHTWMVKLGAVTMAPTAIWVFIGGPALPFHIATVICVLAGLEEIMISIVLNEPYADVRTLLHVLKKKENN